MNVMMHIMLVINSNKPSNKRSVGSELACHGQYHHNTCTGEGELQVCAVYTTRAPIRQTNFLSSTQLTRCSSPLFCLGSGLGFFFQTLCLPSSTPGDMTSGEQGDRNRWIGDCCKTHWRRWDIRKLDLYTFLLNLGMAYAFRNGLCV